MRHLILVTLLWAFSFSLIGEVLGNQVDRYFAVLTRTALAALVFLPWVRWPRLRWGRVGALLGIGAIQLGLMYVCYYQSFALLSVPEVVLFTIFTPLYVAILHEALDRRFSIRYVLAAALAVIGAAVIRFSALNSDYWLGFALVQGSNLCFAIGQVAYKRLQAAETDKAPQMADFAFFYLGALAVALLAWTLWGQPVYPTTPLQWIVLAWLGIGASGIGYFLWNRGATQVDVGTLAVMNNALVPAGLIVNLVLWHKPTDFTRLAIGGAIIAASLLVCRAPKRAPAV